MLHRPSFSDIQNIVDKFDKNTGYRTPPFQDASQGSPVHHSPGLQASSSKRHFDQPELASASSSAGPAMRVGADGVGGEVPMISRSRGGPWSAVAGVVEGRSQGRVRLCSPRPKGVERDGIQSWTMASEGSERSPCCLKTVRCRPRRSESESGRGAVGSQSDSQTNNSIIAVHLVS